LWVWGGGGNEFPKIKDKKLEDWSHHRPGPPSTLAKKCAVSPRMEAIGKLKSRPPVFDVRNRKGAWSRDLWRGRDVLNLERGFCPPAGRLWPLLRIWGKRENKQEGRQVNGNEKKNYILRRHRAGSENKGHGHAKTPPMER